MQMQRQLVAWLSGSMKSKIARQYKFRSGVTKYQYVQSQ